LTKRLDVLCVGRIRQAETALELPLDPFHAPIAFARFAPRIFVLSANSQHPLVCGDFHRLRIHAGQIHVQGELS
jgi:hypothetical protein